RTAETVQTVITRVGLFSYDSGRGRSMALLERAGPSTHDLVMLDEGGGHVTIGKRADNKLVIDDDPTVSRLHAVFEYIGPAWCITDLGSTNGTTVNGQRLFAPRTLHDGDETLMGRTRLVFRDRQAVRDSTTERLIAPPARTPAEQRVLVELCRPILS